MTQVDQLVANKTTSRRMHGVDALRGVAIAQMIAYHFIFDLNYFGWIRVDMLRESLWMTWRAAIVTQFLLLVGLSAVLRARYKSSASDFWRRWLQVAAAALLVSAGSYLVFPNSFIYFGVLHFVALALLLTRPLLGLGAWNTWLGLLALLIGFALHSSVMDPTALNWLGFAAHKPVTEDYVPVFPWIGVVLVGLGLGAAWERRGFQLPHALAVLNARPPRLLVLLGLWPLSVYLLHQPALFAALRLVRALF